MPRHTTRTSPDGVVETRAVDGTLCRRTFAVGHPRHGQLEDATRLRFVLTGEEAVVRVVFPEVESLPAEGVLVDVSQAACVAFPCDGGQVRGSYSQKNGLLVREVDLRERGLRVLCKHGRPATVEHYCGAALERVWHVALNITELVRDRAHSFLLPDGRYVRPHHSLVTPDGEVHTMCRTPGETTDWIRVTHPNSAEVRFHRKARSAYETADNGKIFVWHELDPTDVVRTCVWPTDDADGRWWSGRDEATAEECGVLRHADVPHWMEVCDEAGVRLRWERGMVRSGAVELRFFSGPFGELLREETLYATKEFRGGVVWRVTYGDGLVHELDAAGRVRVKRFGRTGPTAHQVHILNEDGELMEVRFESGHPTHADEVQEYANGVHVRTYFRPGHPRHDELDLYRGGVRVATEFLLVHPRHGTRLVYEGGVHVRTELADGEVRHESRGSEEQRVFEFVDGHARHGEIVYADARQKRKRVEYAPDHEDHGIVRVYDEHHNLVLTEKTPARQLRDAGLEDWAEPDELLCPITLCLMRDPVVASDGHTYERDALKRLLESSSLPTSPLTREKLDASVLLPNRLAAKRLRTYHESLLAVAACRA
jgi:hypothetical protein